VPRQGRQTGGMSPSTAALVGGYALAVPVTLFTPGFLRLWRRREPLLYAAAQGGAGLIVAGWVAKGNTPSALVNGAWLVGFGIAYAAEGRKRAALSPTGG
jgi:hypothetical protein